MQSAREHLIRTWSYRRCGGTSKHGRASRVVAIIQKPTLELQLTCEGRLHFI